MDFFLILFIKARKKVRLKRLPVILALTAVANALGYTFEDNSVAERFELFVNGKELGNSFSELNDPKEQAKRFDLQVEEKNAGDEEAMHFDKDYIEALEYGLAPCAGVGIGIDRLIMLLSGRESIRDVVLFPQLKNK